VDPSDKDILPDIDGPLSIWKPSIEIEATDIQVSKVIQSLVSKRRPYLTLTPAQRFEKAKST